MKAIIEAIRGMSGYSCQSDPFRHDGGAILVRTPTRYHINGAPVYVTIGRRKDGGITASDGGNGIDTVWHYGRRLSEAEIRCYAGKLGLGVLPERQEDGSWYLTTGRRYPVSATPSALITTVEEASAQFVREVLGNAAAAL